MTVRIDYRDGTHRIIRDVVGVQKLVNDGYYMFTGINGERHLEEISKVTKMFQTQDLQFL